MGDSLASLLGNPVYLVLRGFDGNDEWRFGVLGCNGTSYYLRTDSSLIAVNPRDIVEIYPFMRFLTRESRAASLLRS
ncbi:MAG: hypothetical protein RDV48_02215 [Candidatus Eremiobacteraeota bacterium]|nr:hypothetical protein [Candidatus Eremiobacteraeota bacterium]